MEMKALWQVLTPQCIVMWLKIAEICIFSSQRRKKLCKR